ncbi:MAG: MarR family transcriptional regulator [Chloroflexi bacterium]|nr:MarR family transcriptional regulator [Chloroflexota bacterium]
MTPGDEHSSRETLLKKVVDILEEINSSGPYTVSQEWFTLHLRMPHVRVLFLLMREGTLRMSDLASTIDVSMSGATGLVDRLVEQGLVDRWPDPGDRRSVLCSLTEQGKELAHRLLAERRSRWEERLAPMSQANLRKVCHAMELVLEATRSATGESQAVEAATQERDRVAK